MLLNLERFSDEELTRIERALKKLDPARSLNEILTKLRGKRGA